MKKVKWLAYGCPHFPLHDPEAISWVLEQIREYKPNVIEFLGDGIEADAASKFGSEYEFTLEDEFVAHNNHLADVRKIAPANCSLIYHAGNHFENCIEWNRLEKKIRGLCDPRKWRPDKGERELDNWQYIPYINDRVKGAHRIGQVVFCHGFATSADAGDLEAPYFCNEYGLYVHAHTHRPTDGVKQCHRTKARPLRYWYANAGCQRDLKPNYVRRKNTETWGHACVVGESYVTRSPRRSKYWDAEVRLFQTYDQWSDKKKEP